MSVQNDVLRIVQTGDCRQIHQWLTSEGWPQNPNLQLLFIRCAKTPIDHIKAFFWSQDPGECLRYNRSDKLSGILFEIIKRVEIGYYAPCDVNIKVFKVAGMTRARAMEALDALPDIISVHMLPSVPGETV